MSESDNSAHKRRIGEVVGQRYQLMSLLGAGGQGAVYKAYDTKDGDYVAVKVLDAKSNQDPIARERMFREAQAMVRLWGTWAVRVYDQVWTTDGALALVMELLLGEDLHDYLKRIEESGHWVPIPWALSIFEPIILTLERAHAQGIVHRDLKPGNVFIINQSAGGGVRLLDFGFVKFQVLNNLTEVGTIAGSPSYIAPESWLGVGQPTPAVDIYALGALIYRTLAGRTPFLGNNPLAIYRAVTRETPPSLHGLRTELPASIDAWAQRALAKDPKQRFQTVNELWRSLTIVLGRPSLAPVSPDAVRRS